MGWNNYNARLEPEQSILIGIVDAFKKLGLDKLGYQYINLDEGWEANYRDE